jgi:hypothetical protein
MAVPTLQLLTEGGAAMSTCGCGDLLVTEKTFERQVTAGKASKERAAENRRRHKADKA